MKKRIIIYYIVVILFCIMGMFVYPSTNSNTLEAVSSGAAARKDACKEYLNLSDAERKKIDKQYINLYTIEDCNYIINTKDKENSFFLVFESLLDSTLFKFIFPLFVPILLLYPVI